MASQRRLQGQKSRWLITTVYRLAVVALTLLGTIGALRAQPSDKVHPFEEAMKAYKAKKYADAVLLLESILAENRQDEQALYYAALCYLQLQQAGTAYDYLKLIPKGQAIFLDDYFYWLGRASYMNHRFEESKSVLNAYLTKQGSKKFTKDATALLTLLDYATDLMQKPASFSIESAQGINTIANESMPISYTGAQRLWFIRKGKNSSASTKTATEKEGWFLAQKQSDSRWKRVSEENLEKNSFTALQWIDSERSMLTLKGGKLSLMQPTASGWQVLRELNIQFKEASRPLAATLYDQNRKLIFSAFNPETGSLDLFYTELKEGIWSVPHAIMEINSTRDEFTPFFSSDSRTLYFSSKGWNSIGGFDIFKTQYDPIKKRWSTPENVGFPVSSTGDDYWLQIHGDKGFFVSNRSGGMGGDDIYQFFPLTRLTITGKISGKRGEPLAVSQIQFLFQGKSIQTKTDANGYYKAEVPIETDLQLRIWQQGKLQYQENFRISATDASNRKSIQYNFSMQAEKATATVTELVAENTGEAEAIVFAINGNVKDATQKQPLRATIKLIDIETSKTVKFTSTDANGRFNFYLDKPINTYFIEVTARGFLPHWQLGEQIGKNEYSIMLQPIANETNWLIPSVGFEGPTDNLNAASIPILDKISTFLLENGMLQVQIRYPEGSSRMGEKRAKALQTYLAQKGVASDRLSIGVLPNSTSNNRGIELHILLP
jgi:tetratricopeptide (TPR) repeat protein/outer membrane protein OmpA-like peptidoglycan-associated protein